jgi:enamine deaminase RidA (YjgF/YER057c/UK114 family)
MVPRRSALSTGVAGSTLRPNVERHGAHQRRAAFLALPEYDQGSIIEFLETLQVLPEDALAGGRRGRPAAPLAAGLRRDGAWQRFVCPESTGCRRRIAGALPGHGSDTIVAAAPRNATEPNQRRTPMRTSTSTACLLAFVILTGAASWAQRAETERTIHVPPGWEGAYELGYAPAVRVGPWVIVSGIPAGGDGSYEDRIRRMYERARDLLTDAGATFADVVELTTFHLEPKDSAAFGAELQRDMPIHRSFFGEHRPAWSAVGTSALLSPTAAVEMRLVDPD